jgi:cobalamin biosynthesis protein CobD/CbiB
MSPFWSSLFGHLKGCGQNATLFLVALAGFVALLVVVALIVTTELRQYFTAALPWVAGFLVVWSGFTIRRARARRREQALHSPLSDDELAKARSKLGRHPR